MNKVRIRLCASGLMLMAAGLVLVAQPRSLGESVKGLANVKAGACRDCIDGGASCAKSNAADDISAGNSCSGPGVVTSCDAKTGSVGGGSTNSSTSLMTSSDGVCPVAASFTCSWLPDAGGNYSYKWVKGGGSCDNFAKCTANGRKVNDPDCTPPPPPGQ